MHIKPSRRELLKLAAASAVTPVAVPLVGLARAFQKQAHAAARSAPAPRSAPGAKSALAAKSGPAAAKRPEPGSEKLSAYQDGPQIWIRWNNALLTSYRAHPTQKYPYLYPLAGPATGLSLTTETSVPYPHHRSMLFACDRVNGGNYWQGPVEQGQIVSLGPKLGECTPQSAEILDRCEWRRPGQAPVMTDQRKLTVRVVDQQRTFLDAEIRWTAAQDVTIQRTNHSLFSIRAAFDIVPLSGGTLLNSEGQKGEKETFGKPAGWCTYYGKRRGIAGDVVEGIALFNHPANPWKPCPWFTRDYGFISPTPLNFMDKPWQLPAGKSVELRYRVVLYAGTPDQAMLADLYKAWISSQPG